MESSRIIAKVNGSAVTESDVINEIKKMGERGKEYLTEDGINAVANKLIERKLILAGAKRDLIEFDKDFKAQLASIKDDLLVSFALSKKFASINISDDDVKKYYEEHPDDFISGPSVEASHILFDNKEDALNIKNEIINGKLSFEDAARKYSLCPSKDVGGALGEFTRGQMVKEFEDAAFSLEPDVISDPVKTQFGFHLIKVTSVNDAKILEYDAIKDELKSQLIAEQQQKIYQSYINQLKILVPVERF